MSLTRFTQEEIENLNRRDLQKLWKRQDVIAWTAVHRSTLKANAKNAELMDALIEFFKQYENQVEGKEEEKEEKVGEELNNESNEPMEDVPSGVVEPAIVSASPVAESITGDADSHMCDAIVAGPVVTIDSSIEPSSLLSSSVDNDPLSDTIPSADDFPPLDDSTELHNLEHEIEAMENVLAQKPTPVTIVVEEVTKKPTATKKGATVMPAKSAKSTKKTGVKSAPAASPAPKIAARKGTTKKVASKKDATSKIVDGDLPPPSPPANSLASAFSLPTTFAASSATDATVASTTTNSSSSSNDMYWSLMAELDKRVGEKKQLEKEAAGGEPIAINVAPSPAITHTVGGTKKTSGTKI